MSARPDSTWYRVRRFVSRNRWQVAASVVTSLTIIAGAGTALWQAQEIALASMAERSGDSLAAEQHLYELDERLGSSLSSYGALSTRRAHIQSWLDVANGEMQDARSQLDAAQRRGNSSLWTHDVLMSKAEMDLLAGDATSAIAHARAALEKIISRQGGVPYSSGTGHAWLMLARALQAGGEQESAREALQSAVTHLSNTVDADHPALVRAREMLAAMSEQRSR